MFCTQISPLTPSPGSDMWRCTRVGPNSSHSCFQNVAIHASFDWSSGMTLDDVSGRSLMLSSIGERTEPCVSWSTVDLPRRKPACCGSTIWSMRLCINLPRILNLETIPQVSHHWPFSPSFAKWIDAALSRYIPESVLDRCSRSSILSGGSTAGPLGPGPQAPELQGAPKFSTNNIYRT